MADRLATCRVRSYVMDGISRNDALIALPSPSCSRGACRPHAVTHSTLYSRQLAYRISHLNKSGHLNILIPQHIRPGDRSELRTAGTGRHKTI